jgi:hypothetical protein
VRFERLELQVHDYPQGQRLHLLNKFTPPDRNSFSIGLVSLVLYLVPYKPCRIAVGEPTSKRIFAVRSYRSVLNAYVNNAESKFDAPDGKQCCSWTRGMLQRTHIVAGEQRYCGKEFKRKLEQGPVDHEVEFKCKVYENGRVVAGPETLRQLASFSERQIREATGVRRDTIRLIRHGKGVKRSTYQKVINFLRGNERPGGAGLARES